MPLRVAVLDELGIERAHFIGNSWGGRLGFGIGEHAPERVLSLVIGGQQPYAIDLEGPLAHAATETLAESRREYGTLCRDARVVRRYPFSGRPTGTMARQRPTGHRGGVERSSC